ncbi:ERF family protein [Paenibacillus alkalitolerans]|uniref:ERF family protein n=1 Tax=Paenibacillus alkalitolerans TaxID=2799335 RepID=UPI0018F61027|nr:ERF family protein [Paenibacillus alkalitolerans]
MCNKSDSISKIAAALVAFSGEVKAIEKDGTNPHFRSSYTTLDHMIDETKPLLHKHGLTVMQFPGGDGERITVRTMIMHTSGEWIESEPLVLKAVKTDPQGAGSAITYARRYSYAAALSLSLGDDDDGNAASHSPQQARTTAQPSKPPYTLSAPSNGSNVQSGNLASDKQRSAIFAIKNQKNISDDELKEIINAKYGKDSSKALTSKEASELIGYLSSYQAPETVGVGSDGLPF